MRHHPVPASKLTTKRIYAVFKEQFVGYIPDAYNKMDAVTSAFAIGVFFPREVRFSYTRGTIQHEQLDSFSPVAKDSADMLWIMRAFYASDLSPRGKDFEFYFYRSFVVATKPVVFDFESLDDRILANWWFASPLSVLNGWRKITEMRDLFSVYKPLPAP